MATPVGAQLDILGDRMIENVYFTYFAVVGMVSLWLPILFFARGAATDFLRGLAMKAGHSGWGANARSEEHTSELQSQSNLVCRLLLEKKKQVMRSESPRR